MGKAFTEEERISIQRRLRKVGLKLFAEKGIKGVSIRELTAEARISQGGFYTFYKDKEDFLIDLMELRSREKLAKYEEMKFESLTNPITYLADILFNEGMHLKDHKAFANGISGSIEVFYNREKKMNQTLGVHYRNFLRKMIKYWEKEGYVINADIDGLISVIRAAGILFSNSTLINEKHFSKIYRTFCYESIRNFLEVSK